MNKKRIFILICVLATVSAAAVGGWVAGNRIESPAEAAARDGRAGAVAGAEQSGTSQAQFHGHHPWHCSFWPAAARLSRSIQSQDQAGIDHHAAHAHHADR